MKWGDVAVILLAAALIGGLFVWQADYGTAALARIRVGDRLYGEYPLAEPRRIRVPGREGVSVIAIRNGAARFTASPCARKICIRVGWLRDGGETAACLPNGVSLEIVGRDARFDSINF